MIYQRESSALHSTRPAVACLWCAVLVLMAFTISSPFLLLVELLAVLLVASRSLIFGKLKKTVLFSAAFALLWALINIVFSHEGLTVLVRGLELPVFGQMDITLEAAIYGLREGIRVLVIVAIFGLYSLTVDPDRVLKIARRFSFGSALTAAVATRMIPVLAADARRMRDALRARGSGVVSRRATVHALTAGALERSVDVAATLELRGFAFRGRPPRVRTRLSRHDVAFIVSAATLLAATLLAKVTGLLNFEFYPELAAPVWSIQITVALAFLCLTIFPSISRKGVGEC